MLGRKPSRPGVAEMTPGCIVSRAWENCRHVLLCHLPSMLRSSEVANKDLQDLFKGREGSLMASDIEIKLFLKTFQISDWLFDTAS